MNGRRRNHARRPAGSIVNKPLVAIVEDIPGVTRDRHYADSFALGREFVLIDTGGFDPDSDDPMKAGITSQVRLALEECDVVVCVVDATVDPLPADREAVALLRDAGKPVIFVANKADSQAREHDAVSYYELGISSIMPISALHGRGIGDLEEAIFERLPDVVEISETELNVPRVAIIGRPNAGKSSLVNQLCGEERQLVDDRPGTTVDSIDTLIERDGQSLILIDTEPGMEVAGEAKDGFEAVEMAFSLQPDVILLDLHMPRKDGIKSIERSHVVVLMIDAAAGVGEQDAKIAGLVHDRGRALIIALNKTDLLSREAQKQAMDRTREILAFVPWAPMVTVSALEGRGGSRASQAHWHGRDQSLFRRSPREASSTDDAPSLGSALLHHAGEHRAPDVCHHDQLAQGRALQLSAIRGQSDPKAVWFPRHTDPRAVPGQEEPEVARRAPFAALCAPRVRRDCRAVRRQP